MAHTKYSQTRSYFDDIAALLTNYGHTKVCTDNDDIAALDDNDNKTAPQTKQKVEYDHRVATRVIEAMQRAHELSVRACAWLCIVCESICMVVYCL